ncbi:methionyl-tRNA synthetase [Bacteroidetes bacterium UKL13-3]|jgi:methionyl-tRNA synthetase|nr:methionyl-tRNA synthetase [Bacteroidetes bacterium UKL13-3]HCP94654.1 methionine--tRNA ligase [Bacteroidota bacterium]
MSEPKRYLVTAALPYANGPVHIGHLAGCYLPADIYVRYLKARGKDVVFICGSDEHGVPITIKAKKEGITPQQVVDKYNAMMRDSFKEFGIDFSYYGRTSSPTHHNTAQEFFRTLYDKGVFKEEVTKQYYDEEAKQFLADRYITGTCPRCGNPSAYGDQCEKCGTSLSPTDLINPKSALSGAIPVLKETKNWFLPMGELQQTEAFQEYIKRFDSWKSNIKGQCNSWLTEGLQSRAMTRDLDWGVPVPIEGADGKVLYVWFDAPIGYISATKEYFETNPKFEIRNSKWEDYWQDEDSALLHFIGKDNIVFHAIIFPMMLMTHGKYILPTNVPANEFLNLEGDKISTSRNWAVWLHEYLQEFSGKQDVLRYALCAAAPETKDNDFTWKDFQSRNNSELVAILGNFVNRTVVLTHKFYEGKVPAFDYKEEGFDEAMVAMHIFQSKEKIEKSMEQFRFREALFEVMEVARLGNKFLADNEPWKLIKTNEKKTAAIMNLALQICANLSVLMKPFLPHSSQNLEKMMGKEFGWNDIGSMLLMQESDTIGEAVLMYEKIEDETIDAQLAKLAASKVANSQQPLANNPLTEVKPDITYDDFDKLDLRVGKVLEAEKVPKADKLLKLIVDLGFEKRTILSGIAEYYQPEELVGKLVTVVANLAPRKIRGIESQGMLLMAGNDFGKLYSVGPDKDIEPGSVVK